MTPRSVGARFSAFQLPLACGLTLPDRASVPVARAFRPEAFLVSTRLQLTLRNKGPCHIVGARFSASRLPLAFSHDA
jgi:hypothetical protein